MATETRGEAATKDKGKPGKKRTSPLLFYRQVVAELRKVIWPTRHELVTYTTVSLIFVVIVVGDRVRSRQPVLVGCREAVRLSHARTTFAGNNPRTRERVIVSESPELHDEALKEAECRGDGGYDRG